MNRADLIAYLKSEIEADDWNSRIIPAGMVQEIVAVLEAQEPKRGYWAEEPDRTTHWHCSECLKVQGPASILMKYCPNCGAMMSEHPWAGSGCGQAFNPD